MQKNKKASMIFIFITILVDVIGLGIIIPVIPQLLENLAGTNLSQASVWGGLLMFSYAIMQFISAPFIGELSDHFGRRKVLLVALFVLGIDYIFHAVAPTLGWLFIGRILAGLGGGSYSVANAYASDISTPENKAQNFGLIGAAFGLGFILGPVIGGVFSTYGIRVPFYIAAGLTFINLLYGYFVLPESLPKEKRRALEFRKANPIGALKFFRQDKTLAQFASTYFLIFLSNYAVQSTWSYYTMYRFDWNPTIVGYSLGVVGIMVAFVQGGLIRYTSKKFGNPKSVMIGYTFSFLGLILFAFTSQSWMMFAFIVPYCLGGLAGPSLLGMMSNITSETEQGKLQGGLSCIQSLTSIIGPLIMTNIFSFFTTQKEVYFPGASFLAGAVLVLAAAINVSIPLRRIRKEGRKIEYKEA